MKRDSLPLDPFGRSRLPDEPIDRAGRVLLLRVVAEALAAGDPVPAHAGDWLGRALLRWLADGGDLAAVLGVKAPRGSHHTPQRLVLAAKPGRPAHRR